MDDLIIGFMQITYCRPWLKGGPYGKGFDSIFSKLKDIAHEIIYGGERYEHKGSCIGKFGFV